MTEPLILKRAPIGDNQQDYNVLEAGVAVGPIFLVPTGFLAAAGQSPASSAPQRTPRVPSGKPIYTRGQISQMWAMRRRGQIGDAEWARWEYELVAAGREGRIVGALSLEDGIPVTR